MNRFGELKKLNTKNLLRFYKAERNRMFAKGYRYSVIEEDENGPIMGWYTTSKRKSTYIHYF